MGYSTRRACYKLANITHVRAWRSCNEAKFMVPSSSLPGLTKSVGLSHARRVVKPVIRAFSQSLAYGGHSSNAKKAPPIAQVVKDAGFLLPQQAILDNFVHHNPYENLQSLSFPRAMSLVHRIRSRMSPGERLWSLVHEDPRIRAHEAVAELSAVFLDRGAAKWEAPNRDKGFLYFFASLENAGFAPWRRYARSVSARILTHIEQHSLESSETLAETIVQESLLFFGASPEEQTPTLGSMLLEFEGWAGMFQRMDKHPEEAPANSNVRFVDFCAVYSIMLRSSMESLARQSGWDSSTPFGSFLNEAPLRRHSSEYYQNPSGLSYLDQNWIKQEALEKEYEDVTLRAIGERQQQVVSSSRPILQLYTCIDEREESLRRHVEEVATKLGEVGETFGLAGFMGFQIRYRYESSADCYMLGKFGRDPTIMAPEGVQPPNSFVEKEVEADHDKTALFSRRHRLMARGALLWEKTSFSPVGSLAMSALAPLSMGRLALMSFLPETNIKLTDKMMDTIAPKPRTDFTHTFTPKFAAKLLAANFKNMKHDKFAPVVMILGHGSTSANNPYDSAYNCGACGGREGGPNARLMARCANDKEVRELLASTHGIIIPEDTWFVGGRHDTTNDKLDLYDVETLPESLTGKYAQVMDIMNRARGQNALERCQRFMLSNVTTPEEALDHVYARSKDLGEVRPELNHATNAAVIIGRRILTKGRDLNRRSFLVSYDPFVDDDAGSNLEQVLTPALIVCSGINLEYFFSCVDGGAGTKMPMNLVGHFGVQQGASGDLLHGLPTQTTEFHVPVRALYVIDAPVERVKAVLARRDVLREIVHNDWVRFVVRDPFTKRRYKQSQGEYLPIYSDGRISKEGATYVPFAPLTTYAQSVTHKETLFAGAAAAGMLLSCGVPLYVSGLAAMHPHTALVAAGGTVLSLSTLVFSRRYLHGEFMFGRMTLLSAGLLTGFNLVATAPSLGFQALNGWGLMGISSAFLVGVFNDRPTVRENATYAYFTYKVSDLALLTAAAFSTHHLATDGPSAVAASALIGAALLKSSQLPASNLFVRCIEGASPTTAIAYAGISAHAGVVLLSATTDLWFGFDWARFCVGSVGAITAVHAGLAARIRADRKGALANATISTLGMIYCVLAAGYTDAALFLSFGHASFRMMQFLRAPNFIMDSRKMKAALGQDMGPMMEPKHVSQKVYRLGWMVNRINSDLSLPQWTHVLGKAKQFVDVERWFGTKSLELSKFQQWSLTGTLVVLAGMPFTPVSYLLEHTFMDLLHTHPCSAGAAMTVHLLVSTALIRTVFTRVLDNTRFRHEEDSAKVEQAVDDLHVSWTGAPEDEDWGVLDSWHIPDDLEEFDMALDPASGGPPKQMEFPEGSWSLPDNWELPHDSYEKGFPTESFLTPDDLDTFDAKPEDGSERQADRGASFRYRSKQ